MEDSDLGFGGRLGLKGGNLKMLAINEARSIAQECLRERMGNVDTVHVQGVRLSDIGGVPVYEMAIDAVCRNWVRTGPTSWIDNTEEQAFMIQVSAEAGEVVGCWRGDEVEDASLPEADVGSVDAGPLPSRLGEPVVLMG